MPAAETMHNSEGAVLMTAGDLGLDKPSPRANHVRHWDCEAMAMGAVGLAIALAEDMVVEL